MDTNDIKKLRKLTSFEALVDYLRGLRRYSPVA